MAVKIRLKRLGKIRAPHYRIVVADARTKRDGRAIEEIGKYQPTQEPSLIEVNSERAQYWLGVGAQPTEQVLALLKITGDWQKYKGLPGQEGTLRFAEPKADKKAVFEAAAKEGDFGSSEPKGGATTPRAKRAAKPEADAAGAPSEPPAQAPAAAVETVAETRAEPVAEPVAETPAETVAETPADPTAAADEASAAKAEA
ncbi:MAG: 30S ribosomal protein S16 [Actinomycetota bacterium]|nr:30S ribosomal protein S16 [Actinomycetota bacterium]